MRTTFTNLAAWKFKLTLDSGSRVVGGWLWRGDFFFLFFTQVIFSLCFLFFPFGGSNFTK